MDIIDIRHCGSVYSFDPESSSENAKAKFVRSFTARRHSLSCVYNLSGAHAGPTIVVEAVNCRLEYDGFSHYDEEFDSVIWSDNRNILDDIICDTYFDKIREDLAIQLREE